MIKLTASIALLAGVLLGGAWIPVLAAGGVRSETIQLAEIVPATDVAIAEAQAANGTGTDSPPDNAQDAAKPAPRPTTTKTTRNGSGAPSGRDSGPARDGSAPASGPATAATPATS